MIRELNLLLEMDADMPDATISIKPRRSDDQVNHHGDLDQLDDLEKHKGEDDKEETEEKEDKDQDDQKGDGKGDKEGMIRVVKGAHLVYKRKNEDGLYDELWVFPTSNVFSDEKIVDKILAGTDIEKSNGTNEDGTQEYEYWTIGNVNMMKVIGLPS